MDLQSFALLYSLWRLRKGEVYLRQVFIPFTECGCEDLGIRPTKRSFQSLIRNNGKGSIIFLERFPEDAKVIAIEHNYTRAMLYVIIESKEYEDVRAPKEINIAVTKLDGKNEKVQFT